MKLNWPLWAWILFLFANDAFVVFVHWWGDRRRNRR